MNTEKGQRCLWAVPVKPIYTRHATSSLPHPSVVIHSVLSVRGGVGLGETSSCLPIRQSGLPVAAVTHEVTHLSDRRFQKRIQKAENVKLVASGTKDNITEGPPRWRTCTGHVFAVSTPVRMQAPRPTTDLRRLQHPMEVLNSKEFYGLGQTSHLSADKIKQLIYRLERKGVVDGCSLCCWYFTFLCYEHCFLLPVMTDICRSLM